MNADDLFFERAVSQHVDQGNFIARSWLADRIERQLADPDCRFVLLTGAPGVGKTSMVAWLARRHPDALRYFIRSDSVSLLASGSARAALTSFGHQFAARIPGLFPQSAVNISVEQRADRVSAEGHLTGVHAGELVVSPFWPTAVKVTQQTGEVAGNVVGIEADRIITDENLIELSELEWMALRDPAARLAAVQPKQQVLILIDALDELRFQPGGGSLLDWLASCAELPGNLRIVVSARPDSDLLARFRLAQRRWLREEPIDPRDPLARHDVRNYLAESLSDHAVAERIARRAAGNFQYAVAYLRAIESLGAERLAMSGELPADLNALYSFFLTLISDGTRDMRVPSGDGGWRPAWPAIYLPVLAVLAIARGPLSPDEIAILAGLRADREWLDDALGRLSQFLANHEGLFQLFHASMAEFLVGAQVDAMTWNRRVVGHAKARFGDAWETASPYVRRHLAGHAAVVGALTDLVRDADFLAAAEPVTLAPLLPFLDSSLGSLARLYLRARPLLGADPHANSAYLQEAARALTGATEEAIRIRPSFRTLLAAVVQDDCLFTLTGHTGAVTSVSFGAHPDGRLLLASGAADETVRLWDMDTGTAVGDPLHARESDLFSPHTVWSLAFGLAPDGHLILGCGSSGIDAVRVWDIDADSYQTIPRSGKAEIFSRRSVTSVAFAPGHDGRLLLAFDNPREKSVCVYDAATGEPACEPIAERQAPVALARDQHGRLLLVVSDASSNLEVWEPLTGTRIGKPMTKHKGFIPHATFGTKRNGRLRVASGDFNGTVLVWDPLTGKRVRKPAASQRGTCAIGADSKGRPLLAVAEAGGKYTIGVYNPFTGKRVYGPLAGHTGPVAAIAIGTDRDGRLLLASGGKDRAVRVWDPLATGSPDSGSRLAGHLGAVTTVSFGTDRDGRLLLASGGMDQTVRIWDPLLGTAVAGPSLVTQIPNRVVMTWDSRDGVPSGDRVAEGWGQVTSVALATAPDGRLLAARGSHDNAVLVWGALDAKEGNLLTGHKGAVTSVAFGLSSDGRLLLASGSHDGTVRVWDVIAGSMAFAPLTGHQDWVTSVAFGAGADGRPLLASGSGDGTVRVWDVIAGSMAFGPQTGHKGGVLSVAFAAGADGRPLVAAGSRDGTVRVWDVLTGSVPMDPFSGHEARVTALAFVLDPDRRLLLASGGHDRTVRIWDLSTAACTATLWRRTTVRSLAAAGQTLAIADAEGISVIELNVL